MTGFLLKALSVAAGLAVVTAAAVAGVPDPSQSDAENVIVGNVSGNPLGKGGTFGTAAIGDGYVVTVRDINGAAVSGANVTLNFTGTGAKVYNAQIAPATVNCGTKTISKATNASGVATFTPRIAGFVNSPLVEVRANGVLLKLARARSTDIDGNLGQTDLNDANLFRQNFFFNPAAVETDFDVNGATDLNDANLFRIEFFSGASGTYCP